MSMVDFGWLYDDKIIIKFWIVLGWLYNKTIMINGDENLSHFDIATTGLFSLFGFDIFQNKSIFLSYKEHLAT